MSELAPQPAPRQAATVTVDAELAAAPTGRLRTGRPLVVALPLIGWLFLWSFWALWGVFVPLMVLVLGRNPRSVWKEIAGFLQYLLRVTAYLSLAIAQFPGYRNRTPHPVALELEYPPRLSRLLALTRIVLNPAISVICLAIVVVHAVAALTQLFTIMLTGAASLRLQAFQMRMLGIQARTFAFFLSLTDRI